MKKKTLLIIISLMMAVSLLIGCGKTEDDNVSSDQSTGIFNWGSIDCVLDENLGEITDGDNTYRIYRHINKSFNSEEEVFYASVLVKDPGSILNEVQYDGEVYPVVFLEDVDPDIVTSIDVPEFIYKIGDTCFTVNRVKNEPNTTEVILHEGLVKIGAHSFVGSGITSLYIPGTVDNIGVQAFQDCESLKTVEFSPDTRIQKLPNTVFEFCESLEEISIPASVREIEPGAFKGCTGLKSITFENPGSWHLRRKHNGVEEEYDVDVSDPSMNVEYMTDTYTDFNWKKN